MTTKVETVLEALRVQLAGGVDADVTRNEPLPQEVPSAGWVNFNDGNPEQGDYIIGVGYEVDHVVELDVIVQGADFDARKARRDTLLAAIGTAIRADRTLGGVVEDLEIGQPTAGPVAEVGTDDWLGTTVPVTLMYQSTDGLA